MTAAPQSHFILFNTAMYLTTHGPRSLDKACKAIDSAFKAFEKENGKPLSDLDKLVHAEMIENARKNCLQGGFSFNPYNMDDPDWKPRELSGIERDYACNEEVGQNCLNPVKWVFDDLLYCPYIITDSYTGMGTLRYGVTEAMVFARYARAEKLLRHLFKHRRAWTEEHIRKCIGPKLAMDMDKDHDPRFAYCVKYLDEE